MPARTRLADELPRGSECGFVRFKGCTPGGGQPAGDRHRRRPSRHPGPGATLRRHLARGRGKKALLLSACGGAPYSFGPDTWLYDLFTEAGFQVVETHPRLRNIGPGEEMTDINTLVNRLQPEVLFVFEPRLSEQCRLITPKVPVRIVTLDGGVFLHPAPVLVQGLESLRERRGVWSGD